MKHNWYAKETSGGQALVIDEDTGRNVAVAYSAEDAPLLASAPLLLEALLEVDEALRHIPEYGAFVTLANGLTIQPRGRVLAAIAAAQQ